MRVLRGGLVTVAVLIGATGVAHANTFTVANNGDSGTGSLRALVGTAAAGDTIMIPASVGTITLMSPIAVNQLAPGITIAGAGASTTTISGGGTTDMFSLGVGTSVAQNSLSLSGVTLTGGNASQGGAIFADDYATLSITDSVLSGNTTSALLGGEGGAIRMGDFGMLSLLRTTISGNNATATGNGGSEGGGVRMGDNATITVTQSTIDQNMATSPGSSGGSEGGGIKLGDFATATITASTIAYNTATGAGSDGSQGGGLRLGINGTLMATNSTVARNNAYGLDSFGGGIFYESGTTATLLNDTIARNVAQNTSGGGGGLDNGTPSTTTVKNTIISNNSPANSNCGATVTSQGHNIDYGTTPSCGFTGTGDKFADPLLDEAVSNNGGLSPTMALLQGSPAIAAGDTNGCPATDERGVARTGHCDIGAFQFTGSSGPPPPKITPPYGTKITKSKISKPKHRASFRYSAKGLVAGFQCWFRMITNKSKKAPKPHFVACGNGKQTYKHLSPGKYVFEVRAFNTAGVDFPAVKKFTI